MRLRMIALACSIACAHGSAAMAPPGQAAPDQTRDELDQLVAPIALYPDALVAQVLAASTYPTEIVEADHWLQQQSSLQGQQLAQEVDKQSWDPSVKALTQFPTVLANLDKNLSWASALGEAYVDQQQAILDAVQRMRARAQQAGNLQSNSQQAVTVQGSTIAIEPVSPDVVYVPAYDPWIVYGPPLAPWAGWYWYPGLYGPGPGIAFGIGFGIGVFGGFGWGWHHWGADWRDRRIAFDHHEWVSRSRTFIGHDHFYRGGPGFHGRPDFHGYQGMPRGVRSGAFSGFDHAGVTRSFSGRGFSSAGGRLGGFHGGGFHGGHR